MKKLVLVLGILLTTSVLADPPRLRDLMATMGGHAHAMLSGILYDDFEVIQKSVAWVNDHEQPTGDIAKIKKELGWQVVLFKLYDTQAHRAANAMGAAAKNKDMKTVAKNYAKMIKACNRCHGAFRDRLREVLHRDEQE